MAATGVERLPTGGASRVAVAQRAAAAREKILDLHGPVDFRKLLRLYRERAGMSQYTVSRISHVDRGHLCRCELGDRNPPAAEIVNSWANAMGLNRYEKDRLLIAAGYAPQSLGNYGWTPTLQRTVEVLSSGSVEFEDLLDIISRKWK